MEFVYVVPREKLFPDCYPQGLVPFTSTASTGRSIDAGEGAIERARFEETLATCGFFVEREYAERTPTLKQVIPYTVLYGTNVLNGSSGVLLLRRTKGGGEARLHGKHSIGVGGHLNPVDLLSANSTDSISGENQEQKARLDIPRRGALRELAEEITVDGPISISSYGVLNDDSDPVGAVHVGLVQVGRFEGSVRVLEEDQLEGRVVAPEELSLLRHEGANFETWSNILIDRLEELLSPDPESLIPVPLG